MIIIDPQGGIIVMHEIASIDSLVLIFSILGKLGLIFIAIKLDPCPCINLVFLDISVQKGDIKNINDKGKKIQNLD